MDLLRGSVDGMVEKARVARESQAMGRRIARSLMDTAVTRIQLTHKYTIELALLKVDLK